MALVVENVEKLSVEGRKEKKNVKRQKEINNIYFYLSFKEASIAI